MHVPPGNESEGRNPQSFGFRLKAPTPMPTATIAMMMPAIPNADGIVVLPAVCWTVVTEDTVVTDVRVVPACSTVVTEFIVVVKEGGVAIEAPETGTVTVGSKLLSELTVVPVLLSACMPKNSLRITFPEMSVLLTTVAVLFICPISVIPVVFGPKPPLPLIVFPSMDVPVTMSPGVLL